MARRKTEWGDAVDRAGWMVAECFGAHDVVVRCYPHSPECRVEHGSSRYWVFGPAGRGSIAVRALESIAYREIPFAVFRRNPGAAYLADDLALPKDGVYLQFDGEAQMFTEIIEREDAALIAAGLDGERAPIHSLYRLGGPLAMNKSDAELLRKKIAHIGSHAASTGARRTRR